MKRREFIKKSVQAGAAALVGSSVLGCAEGASDGSDSSGDSSGTGTNSEARIIYQKLTNTSGGGVIAPSEFGVISSSVFASQSDICIFNPDTQETTVTSLETSDVSLRRFSLSSDFSTVAHQSSGYYGKKLFKSNVSESEDTETNYTVGGSSTHNIRDIRYSNNDTLLYTVSTEVGNLICFPTATGTQLSGTLPTWAGDNNRVAYVRSTDDIYYNNAFSPNEQSAYIGSGGYAISSLNWSPIEDRITFLQNREGDLYIKTTDLEGTVHLNHQLVGSYSEGPNSVQFSPDGTKIGYAADGNIYTWDYDSSESTLSNKTTVSGISDVRVFEWRSKSTVTETEE